MDSNNNNNFDGMDDDDAFVSAALAQQREAPDPAILTIPAATPTDQQADSAPSNDNPLLRLQQLARDKKLLTTKIEDVHATRTELAIAHMAKHVGTDMATSFLSKFKEPKEIQDLLAYLVAGFKDVTELSCRPLKVDALLKYDHSAIQGVRAAYITSRVPVTPFNFNDLLLANPYALADHSTRDNCIHYRVASRDFPYLVQTAKSAFESSKAIFEAISHHTVGTLYDMVEWNITWFRLAILLSYRVTLTEVNGKIVMQVNEYNTAPPKTILGGYDGMDVIIAEIVKNCCATLPLTHYFNDPTQKLTYLYCQIASGFGALNKDDRDIIQSHFALGTDGATQKVGLPPILTPERIAKEDNFIRNVTDMAASDNLINDAIEALSQGRGFRAKDSATDEFTHDVAMAHDHVHVADSKWGAMHRSSIISHACKYFKIDPKSFKKVNLYGSGADRLATAIQRDTIGFTGLDREIKINMKAPESQNLNVNVTNVTVQDVEVLEENSITLAFSNPPGEKEFYDSFVAWHKKIQDGAKNIVWTMDQNYGLQETFIQMLNYCQQFNIGVTVLKHPRLHNNSYTWIFRPGAYNPKQYLLAMRERYFLAKMVIHNNHWRNTIIYTGWFPDRTNEPAPKSYVDCYSLLLISQSGSKSVGKTVQRTLVKNPEKNIENMALGLRALEAEDAGSEVTASSDNNNNSTNVRDRAVSMQVEHIQSPPSPVDPRQTAVRSTRHKSNSGAPTGKK